MKIFATSNEIDSQDQYHKSFCRVSFRKVLSTLRDFVRLDLLKLLYKTKI